eukprot:356120-Chlamydomonas_euryale.AAC.14
MRHICWPIAHKGLPDGRRRSLPQPVARSSCAEGLRRFRGVEARESREGGGRGAVAEPCACVEGAWRSLALWNAYAIPQNKRVGPQADTNGRQVWPGRRPRPACMSHLHGAPVGPSPNSKRAPSTSCGACARKHPVGSPKALPVQAKLR